jgi:enoyl-CoA hydratase/carnithine racemase
MAGQKYFHEEKGSMKAEEIKERVTPFVETDAGKRPLMPDSNWRLPKETPFEEYAEALSPVFKLKRDRGILEARLHTNGDSLVWGLTPHAYIHKFFEYAGGDRDNEIIIFGGSGKDFFKGIGPQDCYRDTSKPFQPLPEKENPWTLYDHSYYDGTHDIEGQVFGLEVPTIGIWNGGSFHSDLFLYCDITLCTEDAWTTDMHFRLNMMPGDGVQIAWRELMGRKRFAYAELTGQIITAKMAYEWGMVNEVLPDTEACYKRAWEIADLIMLSGNRLSRRMTTQIIRTPWKEDIAKELRGSFATEMYTTLAEDSPHDQSYWEGAKAEGQAALAAEKKGKVVKPRVGPFIEEDPVYKK